MAEDTVWYVDPRGDKYTISVLENNLETDSLCRDKICPDGQIRDVFKCSCTFAIHLNRVRQKVDLTYRLYYEVAAGKQIREWPFPEKIKALVAANQLRPWPRRD
ncbi:MAG: hypothetical protein QOG91_250 [Candidatus Parcubacteria bacterium]|jgi:hypothetical protein|nr:hypothetical protein [Candidatus Parcubacteria bacterium]